jgi:serine/threonine-protein kinase
VTDDETASDSTPPHSQVAVLAPTDEATRYELGMVLGRGGMGEVRAARDTRIDRDVAVKLMREELRDPSVTARFFREARVQGALEHPAVVPIHDLGVDRDGNPFFVMKRLAGTTLTDALAAGSERWPRRLLLGRLVDVCLAIELAHTRGVVHRDVKPSNIMLGDFGEAYILDWGLARIDGDPSLAGRASSIALSGSSDAHTAAGELLGTPGYMAPEQARGEAVGPPADVFSLGLVLYEIVAETPALPRGIAALAQTVAAVCHRPSERLGKQTLDVPPELDDLCARATAQDPAGRPSARRLADGIQAYLDGDRDLTRRRELAAEHAGRSRAALDRGDGDSSRALAMREAGRAIALDPSNGDAQQVLARLLIIAPDAIPAEALAAADAERAEGRQDVLRRATFTYFAMAALLVIILLLPVRVLWPIPLTMGLAIAMGFLTRYVGRRLLPMRTPWYLVLLGVNGALLAGAGLIFGPLLAMPILLTGSLAAFLSQPVRYSPWLIMAGHALPLIVLVGCELTGVLPSTFSTEGGQLVLRSWTLELTPHATAVIHLLVIATQFGTTYVVTKSTRRSQEMAQDRVHAQRWHLLHLVR